MAERILITGGAGFIGSHLTDKLIKKGFEVYIIDNLSSGSLKNIKSALEEGSVKFIEGDLLNFEEAAEAVKNCGVIYHLAANPEVRVGTSNPKIHYKQNITATFNLLEAIRRVGKVKAVVFTSTSTVYGEASEIPTPEDYAPLKPISTYGASKLACEALISAYAYTYGFEAVIFRLANIVGPRSTHGVIYDFIQKLVRNPTELEVLGDGRQNKSYLYIDDCIEALTLGFDRFREHVEVLNVGSEDQIEVRDIAKIVIEEMGLKNVKIKYTGGVDGGRGWKGDVKNMLLDISKIKSLGWRPKYSCEEAVRVTSKELIKELKIH